MDTTIDAPSTAASKSTTTRKQWVGRVLSGIPVLFLLFDVAIKLIGHPAVAEASERLGLPQGVAKPIALLLLGCLALYVVKRTAPIGAVLLTGYLGGAVLVHVRVGDPLFSHTLVPIYVGAMLWAGLYLRDARVRSLALAS
jgi:DoxX-like family